MFSVVISAEWIQIPQKSSENIRKHDLTLDHSTILDNIYSKKDLNNLKYEDLKDLIGSGFENEFGKFLEHHKMPTNNYDILGFDGSEFESVDNEKMVNESVFSVTKQPALQSTTGRPNQETYRNETINFTPKKNQLVDNVRRFDAIHPTKNIDNKLFIVDEITGHINKTKSEVNDLNKITKKKKIVFKLLKVPPSNPLTFSGIIKFLKGIQKSFISDATGGIKNKIKSLENFKDQLMSNISKCLYFNKINFQ